MVLCHRSIFVYIENFFYGDCCLDFLVILEDIEGLGIGDMHAEDFLLQEQLRVFALQFPEAVALCSGCILVEENEESENENDGSDGSHEKHGALVDESLHLGHARR